MLRKAIVSFPRTRKERSLNKLNPTFVSAMDAYELGYRQPHVNLAENANMGNDSFIILMLASDGAWCCPGGQDLISRANKQY